MKNKKTYNQFVEEVLNEERYVIMKASRANSNSPSPYTGPTCQQAGVKPGQIYTDKSKAEQDAKKLSSKNKVGFKVVAYKNKFDEEVLNEETLKKGDKFTIIDKRTKQKIQTQIIKTLRNQGVYKVTFWILEELTGPKRQFRISQSNKITIYSDQLGQWIDANDKYKLEDNNQVFNLYK